MATSGSATEAASVTVQQVAASITLSPMQLSFSSVGETQQLAATVNDQNGAAMSGASVAWASSASTVASVSATGLVTAEADGTATIMATSGSATEAASVTVQQVAASIVLSPTQLSFSSVGETQQLTATVHDQNGAAISGASLTWSSSASTVASVSSTGLVTAEADGTATITATAGSATEAASVTVQQVAASITLSRTRLSFSSVGETRQLNATVRDQNGVTISGASLTWSSDHPGVVRVSSSGQVTAVSVGSATISVEVTGGNQRVTQSLSVTVEPPVLEPSDLCTQNVGTATATFEDSRLEAVIRWALSIGSQDALTCNLLSSITELRVENTGHPNREISLVGIQNLTGLADLSLNGWGGGSPT